jgi:hypothetical protein
MKRRTSLFVLLNAAVLLGLGCEKNVTGPQGEFAGTYRMGKLTSNVQADMTATYQAAEKAMKDLDLIVLQTTSGQLGATILARDPQDRKIQVDLTSLSAKQTRMSIDTGSKASAARVYDAIIANLPESTAQAHAASTPTP